MKCFIYSLIVILCFNRFYISAQQPIQCGTDQALLNNPQLQQRLKEIEKDYQKKKLTSNVIPDMNTVYTIPVVFHVYHLGEAVGTGSNVSDAAIQIALSELNGVFRAQNTYSGVSPDVKIQFVLASRTPNCQPTNGIVRIDGRVISGYEINGISYTDNSIINQIRTLSTWTNSSYINVRIVHKIIGAGAFANYLGDLFMPKSIVQSGYQDVWAHEMGHSMNLYHTFEGDAGGTQCPVNNNPDTDGDRISDTDPHKVNICCDENVINDCTLNPIGEVFKNIMSYSSPQKFTIKQVERMRYALVNYRPGLINSLGKVPPSGSLPALACIPTSGNGLSIYYGISSFNLGAISYTSSSSSNVGINYQDLTCLTLTEFQIGSSNSFSLTGTYGNSMWGSIFIDYNNDGDFDDSNEHVYNSNGAYTTFSGVIITPIIPLTNTLLRMRVVLDGGYNPTACNLPGNSGYGSGSIVDFSVIVKSPCPINLDINTNSIVAGEHKSSNEIKINQNVPTGVILNAKNRVILEQGFQAGSNKVFEAKIGGCQN
ncbi:M43 family zinc metalloprotease [Lacihabitans lacunae]|uniref:M43 family zinc metalloprotease n=1 Tax=Lacihabitans lacunae TaxID=1028214 RepID=A0ABV7YYI7_9BACT